MKSNYLIIFFYSSLLLVSPRVWYWRVVIEKESGLPIPGVNIQIKNSTKGTATDFDGKFSLKGLPSGSTVVFTYIGFKDFEYKVGNNSGLVLGD
jgi:hypothetical protein